MVNAMYINEWKNFMEALTMQIKYINNQGEPKAFTPGWNKGRHVKRDYELFIDGDFITDCHSEAEARSIASGFVIYDDTKIEIIKKK